MPACTERLDVAPSHADTCPLVAKVSLPTNTPMNLIDMNGDPLRTDSSTSPTAVGTGDGSTPPESYTAVDPNNPSSTTPLAPNSPVQLRSTQTGQWCRLAPLPADSDPCTTQGLLCDQPTASTATSLTWSGNGLQYNGVTLGEVHSGGALTLSNDPACLKPCADKLLPDPLGAGELHAQGTGRSRLGIQVGTHVVEAWAHCPCCQPGWYRCLCLLVFENHWAPVFHMQFLPHHPWHQMALTMQYPLVGTPSSSLDRSASERGRCFCWDC